MVVEGNKVTNLPIILCILTSHWELKLRILSCFYLVLARKIRIVTRMEVVLVVVIAIDTRISIRYKILLDLPRLLDY